MLQIPVYDITSIDPPIVNNYDVAILGTPVNGFRPATETLEFISRLPESKEKPIVLFCSYALWTGRTFTKLESELKRKGFQPILRVKKKMKRARQWVSQDFAEAIVKIRRAIAN